MNWISVEESLPEVNPHYDFSDEVLVTVEDRNPPEWGNFPIKVVYTAVINHKGVWLYSWDHSLIEKGKSDVVIGWRPMPEPM